MELYRSLLGKANVGLDAQGRIQGDLELSNWTHELVYAGMDAVGAPALRQHVLGSLGLSRFADDAEVLHPKKFSSRVRSYRKTHGQKRREVTGSRRKKLSQKQFPLSELARLLAGPSTGDCGGTTGDDDDGVESDTADVNYASTACQTDTDLSISVSLLQSQLADSILGLQQEAARCAAAKRSADELGERLRAAEVKLSSQQKTFMRDREQEQKKAARELRQQREALELKIRQLENTHKRELEDLRGRLAKRKQGVKNLSRKVSRRDANLQQRDEDDNEGRLVETRAAHAAFTRETVLAVLYCKAAGVADRKVGPLLSRVASCFGVELSSVPGRSTVGNMISGVARALVQAQVRSAILPRVEAGFGTSGIFDETTIGVDKLQVYGAVFADAQGLRSLVLGVPRVVTKASDEQLRAYLETLQTVFDEQKDAVLANLAAVMGDSASTQRKFVSLLEAEKLELEDSLRSDEPGQITVQKVVGVFCQVHALSNAVMPVLKAIRASAEEQFASFDFQPLESLLYNVAQAFARRSAAKIAMTANFENFLKKEGVKTTVLPSFRGNRFFIACTIGTQVFHLRQHMVFFARQQKPGREKNVAQARLLSIVERELQSLPVVLQLRVLVLLDTLVFGPLWAAVGTSSINEARDFAPPVVDFCQKVVDDPASLFGPQAQVPTYAQLTDWRLEAWREAARSAPPTGSEAALFQLTKAGFAEALKQLMVIFTDFLPGGCWEVAGGEDEMALANSSADNSAAERAFAIARHHYQNKPNMLHPRREVELMMLYNGTADFLDAKPMKERLELIDDCMAQRTEKLIQARKDVQRHMQRFAERNAAIVEIGIQQERAKAEARQRTIAALQSMGGRVQSVVELDERLASRRTEKEKREFVVAALKYFRNILGMHRSAGKALSYSSPLKALIAQLKAILVDNTGVRMSELHDCYRWEGLPEGFHCPEQFSSFANEVANAETRPLLMCVAAEEDEDEAVVALRVHCTGQIIRLDEDCLIELIEEGVLSPQHTH